MEELAEDYIEMQPMIFSDIPDSEDIIGTLKKLEQRINFLCKEFEKFDVINY